MTEETKREHAFYVVRPDGRKIIMTLDSVFGENDEETESCIEDLKEAFAEGASFSIMDAEEAFKSFSSCECRFKDDQSNTVLICEECSKLPCHNPDVNKLWAVNIPPEPDSIQFYPVPSLEIAQELTERLKKEALAKFKITGDVIADSIYFEEWKGTEQEHADYLKKMPNWWNHATFLDERS